jgi:hypothetical protein
VSATVTVTFCFAPSLVNVTGSGHEADNGVEPGVQVNEICTGPAYQPWCLPAALDMCALIVGFVTFGGGEDEAVGEGVGDAGGAIVPTCSMTVPDVALALEHPEYTAVTTCVPVDKPDTGPSVYVEPEPVAVADVGALSTNQVIDPHDGTGDTVAVNVNDAPGTVGFALDTTVTVGAGGGPGGAATMATSSRLNQPSWLRLRNSNVTLLPTAVNVCRVSA